MLINNPEALKSWLVVVLEPLCDADSSALARYVLALLKKDKPEKELKRVMIEQLDVFLGEATKPFVEKLFNAMTSEEYLTSAVADDAGIIIKSAFDGDMAMNAATDCDSIVIKMEESNADNAASLNFKTYMDQPSSSSAGSHADKVQTPPNDETKTKETHNSLSKTNDASSSSSAIDSHRSPHSNNGTTAAAIKIETPAYGGSQLRNASPPNNGVVATTRTAAATTADKENQPRESRRRRASLRSRSRSRSHSNERLSRRSRSRDRRINEREKNQRQFRNKSPPSSDFRHNDRRRGGGGDRNRRVASGGNANSNLGERSPRFGGMATGGGKTGGRSPRSRSPSMERTTAGGGGRSGKSSPNMNRGSRSSPDRHAHHASSSATSQQQQQPQLHEGENRQRCRDFDEKGYCVRGETCPWDHGINPVVFEGINNPAMLSMTLRGEYNPDAPDLWSRSSPAGGAMVAGSINPFTGAARPGSVMLGVVGPGAAVGFPGQMEKGANGGANAAEYARQANGAGFRASAPMIPFPFNPAAVTTPLQRELIPIPVVDASGAPVVGGDVGAMQPGGKRRFELEDSVAIAEGPTKRKLPLNSRLGPRIPNIQTNCSLELRKVPRGLNSIAHLNNHFAKFGKIVNIQVSYEGDPEAAIVTFSTHAEANVAYRSTEAVLNNRFIKVFWHSNNQESGAGLDGTGPIGISGRKSLHNHSQYHLNNVPAVPTPSADSAKISNVTNASTSQNTTPTSTDAATTVAGTTAGSAAVTTVAVAHIPTPSLRLKNNMTARPVASIRKKQEEQAKAVVQLAHGLRKRKQELLQSYVKQMKSALELVERCEQSDPQRGKTLATIKVLQETIDKLRKEIAVETEQMQAQIQNQQPSVKKTKEQQKKELLDIELELIAQQQEGNDTTAIQKRLEELQRSLGIVPGSTVLNNSATGMSGMAPGAVKSPHFPGGGRPLTRARASYPDTRVDRRPKTIVVTGFTSEEADFVLGHFKHFGEITKHDVDREIPQLILSYATRLNAEQAVQRGKLFKDKRLQVTWAPVIIPPPTVALSANDNKSDATEKLTLVTGATVKEKSISESEPVTPNDTLPELRLEDEEEDEESEMRSWRH